MLMVTELHRRGFERLRIAPYMAPSGLYWRCCFVPKAYTARSNGAVVASAFQGRLSKKNTYSSGSEGRCQGEGQKRKMTSPHEAPAGQPGVASSPDMSSGMVMPAATTATAPPQNHQRR